MLEDARDLPARDGGEVEVEDAGSGQPLDVLVGAVGLLCDRRRPDDEPALHRVSDSLLPGSWIDPACQRGALASEPGHGLALGIEDLAGHIDPTALQSGAEAAVRSLRDAHAETFSNQLSTSERR